MPGRQTQSKRPSKGLTTAQHAFAQIPRVSTPRSSFNRSCGFKTTFDGGMLVPVFTDEALPGDTMVMKMTSFARMATPLHPIMDNMRMEVFFFAVPLRLLWTNFQKFMGEQDDPGDSTTFVVPQMNPGGSGGGRFLTLWDYFGLPIDTSSAGTAASFHFRAYNLIWNTWFRDENLQDSAVVDLDDGPDAIADYPLQHRGKRHDYFTSCLPFAQKGTAVELPLGISAPVVTDGTLPSFEFEPDTSETPQTMTGNQADRNMLAKAAFGGSGGADQDLKFLNSGLEADLTSATAATINQIREAFQIQKIFERDARGGTRYTEILLSHFGVTSPDSRLQRPEYLGGGGVNITVNPVAQTTATDGTEVKGSLAAYVTAASSYPSWNKSFTEHCVIIGLVSVRADLNYQETMARQWSRSTRFDYYWPALAHIGEQAVLNKEIHMDGGSAAGDDNAFGYQERWAEYRYKPSLITGQFRSSHGTSLDTWHLAQDFGSSVPVLNAAFIEDTPPIARVIAVPSEPEFLLDCYFQYTSVRPMPTYSVPGLIDHF